MALEHHATNPKVGKIVAWVGHYPPRGGDELEATAVRLMKAVAEKNPDQAARGQAMLAIAYQAFLKHAVGEYKKVADVESLAAEAEKAYEKVVNDYSDCPWLIRKGRGTLGERAKRHLFELRNLRVGKTPPEIVGEDLDGAKLKLSDFRGKVTVLVFWTSWCGPCMRMVPQERKLVARWKDKPFALIGINGDEDWDAAKKATVKEEMTWRSFWDRPKSLFWDGVNESVGPIARAWNLHGWPEIYVLDPKGVIRAKGVRGEDLDKAVEELLKEMADAKK
jgi:thiol-disulfide isomerase/thioredoxin